MPMPIYSVSLSSSDQHNILFELKKERVQPRSTKRLSNEGRRNAAVFCFERLNMHQMIFGHLRVTIKYCTQKKERESGQRTCCFRTKGVAIGHFHCQLRSNVLSRNRFDLSTLSVLVEFVYCTVMAQCGEYQLDKCFLKDIGQRLTIITPDGKRLLR